MEKKVIFLIFCLTLILNNVLGQNVLAIGQMTKPIVIKDVLRGQEVTAILYLVNSEDKEVTYQLKAEGEIVDWESFYKIDDKNLEDPITEIQVSAKSRADVIVKFTIPEYTPNGDYNGEVAIMVAPDRKESEGVNVSVGLRIGREVLITVTDKEITEFDATVIPLKYEAKKGEPLKIKVIYNNQGNVFIKPDISLKIIQISTGNTIYNVIYPYPEGEGPIKPFERKEFPDLIQWPTVGQEDGFYRAEIKILLNKEVTQEEDFRFAIGDVADNKTENSKFLAAVAFIGFGNIVQGWLTFGALLLIIAGALIYFYKKKIHD